MTVVFGIVCFFFMPDTPAAAGFLSAEQKEWALLRMRIDSGGSTTVAMVEDEKFGWHQAKMALLAPQVSSYYDCRAWAVTDNLETDMVLRVHLVLLARATLRKSKSTPSWID
jgi:hypothetical protein